MKSNWEVRTIASPMEVAEWMFEELRREKYLYQETVVYDIEDKFGVISRSCNANFVNKPWLVA